MELNDLFENDDILFEDAVHVISAQQAVDRKMFGPVYHGTTGDIEEILKVGFNNKYSVPRGTTRTLSGNRPAGTANGYALEPYGPTGIAAPVHHLGFGQYFTTVKAIAKNFNGGTTKNLKTFYLDLDPARIKQINFGASSTMSKWWFENGYDMTVEATRRGDWRAWVKATGNLTRNLRQRYDAVYYLGKGMRKLLDGDQICVYDPSKIYVINPKLATGLEIGATVYHTQAFPEKYRGKNEWYMDDAENGWKGMFRSIDWDGNEISKENRRAFHKIPPATMPGKIVNVRENGNGEKMYDVKWAKGGIQHNYTPDELRPK